MSDDPDDARPRIWTPETVTRPRRLRREMTEAECLLWGRLRAGRLDGWRFRRPHPTDTRPALT